MLHCRTNTEKAGKINFSSIALAEPSDAEWKAMVTQAGNVCNVMCWAIVAASTGELFDTREKSYNMFVGAIQSCPNHRDALPSSQ